MSLTCPRCETDVADEALYCPYCSLPKPKAGFTVAVEGSPESTEGADPPKTPVGVRNTPIESKRSSTRPRPASTSTSKSKSRARKSTAEPRALRLPVISAAALVALLSVGIYIFVVPLVYSDQAEPKIVMSALETLRKMPSNEEGLTIDARLGRELETARRVKNLVSYQGWTVRPIKGSRTQVLIAFSYQEVGDVNQRAEWVADLTNSTFIPQTDLAIAVSRKKDRE